MNDKSDLAERSTITELCGIYQQAETDIRAALGMIENAQSRLCQFFDGKGYGFCICDSRCDLPNAEDAMNRLHKAVWGALVERLEIRKLLSLARIKDLDKQLESGEGLPPITFENIMTMLESNLNNAGQYLEEKIHESYEWLRPTRSQLKTNQASCLEGVGRKVILTWYMVRRNYSGRGFQVNYDRQDHLRALDQVFHLLDGKSVFAQSYRGALCDAIEAQTKEGGDRFETEYFQGRCFNNGNLHLEIKRADLLERFNLVAGGARLQDTNPKHKPAPTPNQSPKPKATQPTGTAEEQIAAVMNNWQQCQAVA